MFRQLVRNQTTVRCVLLSAQRSSYSTEEGPKVIQSVSVIGSGLMGSGIAQVTAWAGFPVAIVDVNENFLNKARIRIQESLHRVAKKQVISPEKIEEVINRISYFTDPVKAVKDAESKGNTLVVEAIVENLDAKRQLFKELDVNSSHHTLFASNTSSLRISDISAGIREDRFGGLHFFNPVPVMELLEVISTPKTSPATHQSFLQWGKHIGKKVVTCKDTPGFIVNRLLVPYMFEAIRMVERGDATKADIDTAMKSGAGYPMGPFELLDYVGLDTTKFIMDGWEKDYPQEASFRQSELLSQLVKEGKLGRKSGAGFYDYQPKK